MSYIIVSIFRFIFTMINLMAIISDINMWLWQWLKLYDGIVIYCTPRKTKLLGSILVSLHPSVCPSVHLSIHPSCIPCPLCSAFSSGWIHFIFIHLIERRQMVCHVWSFLQIFKIWIFGNFLKFVTLTFSCFDHVVSMGFQHKSIISKLSTGILQHCGVW